MQGLEVFNEEHGRYPDLVVLHSNYWDVAQIVLFREDDGKEHAYGPLMKAWLANAEKVAKFLQVPPVHLMYLIVWPSFAYTIMCPQGRSEHPTILQHLYMGNSASDAARTSQAHCSQ